MLQEKKGSGRPKASSCMDDHLLKFAVLKDLVRNTIVNACLPQLSMEEGCHGVGSLFSCWYW